MASWLYGPDGWDASFRGTFLQWGSPEHNVLGYPKLSQELLERSAPEYVYRACVNAVTDFTRGNADYILFNKLKNAYTERWKSLGEFEDLPPFKMGWARSSIKVEERGISINMTEREQIFSRENIESIVRRYLSQVVARSIDVDILENALLWTDIVAVKTTAGLRFIKGKAIGDPTTRQATGVTSKTFFAEAGAPHSFSVPIIFQTDWTGNTDRIGVNDFRYIHSEFVQRRMKARTNYVIMNVKAFNDLFEDPFFQTIVSRTRPERFERGELGEMWGFTFIIDNSGELERIIEVINNTLSYDAGDGSKDPASSGKEIGSIVFFIAEDGYREAIALPETVATDVPVSFGRYTRLGARTYRGEQPMWFYADPNLAVDPNTGGPLPDNRRVSSGIVLIGK